MSWWRVLPLGLRVARLAMPKKGLWAGSAATVASIGSSRAAGRPRWERTNRSPFPRRRRMPAASFRKSNMVTVFIMLKFKLKLNQRQTLVVDVSCSFQKRTTLRLGVSKSGQSILAECLRGTGGRCPPDPLGFIALELETAEACRPDQARAGPLLTGVWWRLGPPSMNRLLALHSTTCVERPCRPFDSSAFARTSGFANYKLSAFANYSRPLLLAPRHRKPQNVVRIWHYILRSDDSRARNTQHSC